MHEKCRPAVDRALKTQINHYSPATKTNKFDACLYTSPRFGDSLFAPPIAGIYAPRAEAALYMVRTFGSPTALFPPVESLGAVNINFVRA